MDLYLSLIIICICILYIYINIIYIVGGFNPFEKYARQNGFIFPQFSGVKIKNIYSSCHHPVIVWIHMGVSKN